MNLKKIVLICCILLSSLNSSGAYLEEYTIQIDNDPEFAKANQLKKIIEKAYETSKEIREIIIKKSGDNDSNLIFRFSQPYLPTQLQILLDNVEELREDEGNQQDGNNQSEEEQIEGA